MGTKQKNESDNSNCGDYAYIDKHKEKRSKALVGEKSLLGTNDIYQLMSNCFESLNIEGTSLPNNVSCGAALILASAFSGREYTLIPDTLEFETIEVEGKLIEYPKLPVDPDYAEALWEYISNEIDSSYNKGLYLYLPSFLTEHLKKAITPNNSSDLEVKKLFEKAVGSRMITSQKVSKIIDKLRFSHKISAAELCIIKNATSECINLKYGTMCISMIQDKLNEIVRDLVGLVKEFELTHNSLHGQSKRKFGSNYTPSAQSVAALFCNLADAIDATKCTSLMSEYNQFNNVTIFVALYLQLSTLHRPQFTKILTRSKFDLTTKIILVEDKQNPCRILYLTNSAVNIIHNYLRYLKVIQKRISAFNYEAASTINYMLNKDTCLFRLFSNNGKLIEYSWKTVHSILSELDPELGTLKDNFARHYGCSLLCHNGVNRDDLAHYMGHSKESQIENAFSTFSPQNLRAISEKIEQHILSNIRIPIMEKLI